MAPPLGAGAGAQARPDRPGSRDTYLWASNIASRVNDEVAADLCAMAAVRWLANQHPIIIEAASVWVRYRADGPPPRGDRGYHGPTLDYALFAAVEAVIRSRGVVPPPTAPAG